MRTSPRDRIAGGLAAALAISLLGAALFFGLAVDRTAAGEPITTVLDMIAPEQRRPLRQRPIHRPGRIAKAEPAPPNLKSVATEIVAPTPLILSPPPIPIVVAPIASIGSAASSGASDRPGPGSGAGGNGGGTGGGGTGDGDGDETPPMLRRGRLRYADLPAALREAGVEGRVEVRYGVEVNGHVGPCSITASSGNAALDGATCQLIQRHFLFRPSRDADGRPVGSAIEESHSWIVDRGDNPPHP